MNIEITAELFVDLLIGVHCTHGINRTGYLISRYLIDRCDWSADAAMGGKAMLYSYMTEKSVIRIKIPFVYYCRESFDVRAKISIYAIMLEMIHDLF